MMSILRPIGWLLPLMFLAACDGALQNIADKSESLHKHLVGLPSLPIIEKAVLSLVPMVNGQRNDLVMRHVCALARRESSQEQVSQALRLQGIEISNIPTQGHDLSILIDTNQPRRITACAAYIATSVMTIPKASEFMIEQSPGVSGSKEPSRFQINQSRLKNFLRVQLAVAKADADIFTLIAIELEQTTGLTIEQYNARAGHLFSVLAPAYLQRVKELYDSSYDTNYKLLEFSDSKFEFSSTGGHFFSYDYSGLTLVFNRIPWYGSNYLMGSSRFFYTSYYSSELLKEVEGISYD